MSDRESDFQSETGTDVSFSFGYEVVHVYALQAFAFFSGLKPERPTGVHTSRIWKSDTGEVSDRGSDFQSETGTDVSFLSATQ